MQFLVNKFYFGPLSGANQANLFQLKKRQCSKDRWACHTIKIYDFHRSRSLGNIKSNLLLQVLLTATHWVHFSPVQLHEAHSLHFVSLGKKAQIPFLFTQYSHSLPSIPNPEALMVSENCLSQISIFHGLFTGDANRHTNKERILGLRETLDDTDTVQTDIFVVGLLAAFDMPACM